MRARLWPAACLALLVAAAAQASAGADEATPAGGAPRAAVAASPFTAEDDTGQRITLAAPPQRIITLTPHATELVYAAGAGDRLVGTVDSSDFPPAARDLPRVGNGITLDPERIAALRPDLVIGWRTGRLDPADSPLARLGIPLYLSAPARLADLPLAVARLGELLGASQTARPAADALQARLDALERRYAARPPVRVFLQIGAQPLFTLNGAHIASDLLRVCGAVNVFAGLAIPAPQVSAESVLAAGPDAIVMDQDEQAGGAAQAWSERGLEAARAGRLYALPPSILWRPGPRMIDAAEQLCPMIEQARAGR